jgi:CheY-like chemotaxis protein
MINPNIKTGSASRPRGMIVDDNQDVLLLMRDIIEQCVEADIQYFHSPHMALATFTSAPEAFDFVITDLEMPGMSGLELGGELRKLSPALKVLLLTGSQILTRGEAVQKGFCGLLHKPFRIESLENMLTSGGILKMPVENKSRNFQALTAA